MLCVYRGEAVRLFHVWHEVFPALPPGETQTHSYGYAAIYHTQFKLLYLKGTVNINCQTLCNITQTAYKQNMDRRTLGTSPHQ